MVGALNKMTRAGMPESVRIAWKPAQRQGMLAQNPIYATKPLHHSGFIHPDRIFNFGEHILNSISTSRTDFCQP